MQIVVNILLTAGILLIIASSFYILYAVIKFFHIAHAAIITTGAYSAYFFQKHFLFPLPLALLSAIVTAVIIGLLCNVLVYQPLGKKKAPGMSFLLASIGLYVILQNCISLCFGEDSIIINTSVITVGHEIAGAYITTIQIATILIAVILFIVFNIFLRSTTTGKSIRAASSNPELCDIYGISFKKITLTVFTIGSTLAAIAGILTAMDTNVTPNFGFNLLLYGVVTMIIGGVGRSAGLLPASLLVATTQHLAAYFIDTKWIDAVTYIILILFLIWKPLGFSGRRLKKITI